MSLQDIGVLLLLLLKYSLDTTPGSSWRRKGKNRLGVLPFRMRLLGLWNIIGNVLDTADRRHHQEVTTLLSAMVERAHHLPRMLGVCQLKLSDRVHV